jgi:hypothetical protein
MNSLKKRIIKCLAESKIPLCVENIRTACHIGNWNTALKHCLELLLENRIQGQDTSRGWIFWLDEERKEDSG